MMLRRRSTFAYGMAPFLAASPLSALRAQGTADTLTIAFPVDIPHWDPEGQTGGVGGP